MSEIDKFSYKKLGIFYRLPVYQPLEPMSFGYRNPQDGHKMPPQAYGNINIDPACILIGGGSGEHPAVIFHDIEHAVARYLLFTASTTVSAFPDIGSKASALQSDLQTIHYCEWTNETHVRFRERCRFDFEFYQCEVSFEGWLLLNLGEFVFHVLPGFSDRITEWRKNVGSDVDMVFQGISCLQS